MLKNLILSGAAVLALALTGCATSHAPQTADTEPFLDSVQQNADGLVAQLRNYPLGAPVIVASAQNGDYLPQVCPQGRLIADIVSSRLTQRGVPVTEVRLAQALRINAAGETILSRELTDLAKSAKADVVVAATWTTVAERQAVTYVNANGSSRTASYGTTYVTLKAVRIADGLVLGSQTFTPPATWNCDAAR